jgi:glycosyltransferase involved in cell wall biosynthesis
LEIADGVGSDVGFVFIGEGSMEAELRRAVRAKGLDDGVGFVGPVLNAMPLLGQLGVLALPSRHEGLPMVLLEAAVLGLPVVAFDIGGVRQVLDGGPAATVMNPGDVSGFSRELERVIRAGHELDEDVATWAEPVRERFDVRSIVASYRKLYQLALGRERM